MIENVKSGRRLETPVAQIPERDRGNNVRVSMCMCVCTCTRMYRCVHVLMYVCVYM